MRHYVQQGFLDPTNRLGVVLAGVGGTGSHVLTALGRMHAALVALGHPGLYVCAVDDDLVQPHNLARQVFAPCDVGLAKAAALVTRINRHYSLDWDACPGMLGQASLLILGEEMNVDILVSCVDSAMARRSILAGGEAFATHRGYRGKLTYWLDFGNLREAGQVILGTLQDVPQPKGAEGCARLPHVLDLFPDMADEPETPSCSALDSLERQDLFINPVVADLGVGLLWRLLRHAYIEAHGFFVNLADCQVSPLRVDPAVWAGMGCNIGMLGAGKKTGKKKSRRKARV
jgi:PRTRC genetic system ThiF family protein